MQSRKTASRVSHHFEIQLCGDNTLVFPAGTCQDASPRIDDHAVAIGGYSTGADSGLAGSDNKALVFDGPAADQHLPVCFTRWCVNEEGMNTTSAPRLREAGTVPENAGRSRW